MKKILLCIMLSCSLFISCGSSIVLAGSTGDDVAKKKSECLAANSTDPNKVSYCNCVADGGVKLNTDVPFVGKCINKTDTSNAFPALIGGLSKMVVTVILIVSFMFVIIGGVQRASGNPKEGKAKITKVAIGLAILGAS